MAESCGCSRARSASASSSRANFATLRTLSRVSDMIESNLNSGERQFLDRPLNLAAADALHTHAGADGLAVLLDLNALKIRLEAALGGAGDLLADAAEVLGLPAVGLHIADHGLLPAHRALHTHGKPRSKS